MQQSPRQKRKLIPSGAVGGLVQEFEGNSLNRSLFYLTFTLCIHAHLLFGSLCLSPGTVALPLPLHGKNALFSVFMSLVTLILFHH